MKYDVILLDGSAFLFRAYFSTLKQGLTNRAGFPTGAIFGVIGAIKRLQSQHPQAKLIAIFDAKGKNFRHELYEAYKANRKPAEDDLIIQIEPLYEIIRAMDLAFLCVPKVEADDVIATLAKRADAQNLKTLIASGDKDLMQLVTDNVSQISMVGDLYNIQGVEEKMGVTPEKILDLLALTGDSADNIPGVPSVGPKTAIKWLQTYESVEGVKQNADKIKGKVGEKLRASFDLLDLSYQLVSLKFDVEISEDIFMHTPKANTHLLAELYQEYGFFAWFNQLNTTTDKTPQALDSIKENDQDRLDDSSTWIDKYTQNTLLEWVEFEKLLLRLQQAKSFVFDLETTSLDYMNACIVGWVFLVNKDSFYIPVGHDYFGAPAQLDFAQILTALTPILQNEKIGKIGQNLKYDSHILANYDISLNGIVDDTMLKSYVLNATATRHNMDDLSAFYLNHQTIHFEQVAGKGKKQIGFNQVTLEVAAPYACEDVIVTDALNLVLAEKLSLQPLLYLLYQKIELPLIKVLVKMERNGVHIDKAELLSQQTQVLKQMAKIQQLAFEMVGNSFNLESPKQIQQILFEPLPEGLGLEPKKKTPKGAPSTNEEALKLLEHPLVDLILEYRGLTKLNSTYLEVLPKQIDIKTQRLHTSYHQGVTATGRLSSSNPNLQNIPIKTPAGAAVRGAFIAGEGKKIIAADYSQIELRIMAHISQDEGLLSAFNSDKDVHAITASTMFGVALDTVTTTQRRNAKAINFGLIYGMSAFGLAKQLDISRTQAKVYIEAYFETYPGVANYMESIKNSAKEHGFVETIVGRRLYLPAIGGKNKMLEQHALRAAINAPMQGSSADIIKQAMLDIFAWSMDKSDIKMLMQVHDELVFEVAEDKVEIYRTKITELMVNAYVLDIPLKVDTGIGDSWQQAH
jgi:DNA polymerase-1